MQVLQFTLFLLAANSALWLCIEAEEVITVQSTDSSRPYLLVATANKILRMNLNGTNVTTLIMDSAIEAVDYHYRLNLVFWMTSRPADIKYASLSDGSNITALRIRNIEKSVGLAVDWIKDKVYWADNDLDAIYAYDLTTKLTTKLRDLTDSHPTKLKIFPQSNNSSLLYMGDLERNGIFRIPMDGNKEEKMVIETKCPYSLTLDYTSRDLYWLDGCNYQMGTSKIDGSRNHLIRTGSNRFFPYGSAIYDNHIYWTQAGEVSFVYCFEMRTAVQDQIYSQKKVIMRDIQIVHPSSQPSLLELGELDSCLQGCENGNCIESTGVCTCDEGWTGPSCSTDVKECDEGNGGCQQLCVDTPGSFHCECEQGMVLDSNKCSTPPPTTATSAPPTTSALLTTLPLPHTTAPLPTTLPRPTLPPPPPPTSAPTTPPPPPTSAPPNTSAPPTTLPTSAPTPPASPTTPAPPTTTTPPTSPTSASPTTLSTTISTDTDTSPEHQTDQPMIDISTDPDHFTSTDESRRRITEDGLQAKKNSTPMILVVVFSAVALIIVVVASIYIVFLFLKCKQRRKGSYNVHLRHQEQVPRLDPNAEFGTTSVRSSFRDITEQYQRERALQGVAELGYAGGDSTSYEPASRWSRSDVCEVSSSCGLIMAVEPQDLHSDLYQESHNLSNTA